MFDVSPWLDALIRLLLVALILTVTWVINQVFEKIVIGAVSKRNRNVAYEISSVGVIVIWMAGVLLTLPVLGASDTVVSVVILLAGAFLDPGHSGLRRELVRRPDNQEDHSLSGRGLDKDVGHLRQGRED